MNRVFTIVLFLISLTSLNADIAFEGLDLYSDGRLLYSAQVSNPGSNTQKSLFIADLDKNKSRILTAFPEKLDILDNGKIIQIRNSFGAYRFPISGGLPLSVTGFPGFTDGAPVQFGQVEAMAPSPDGKWILYIEPVSAGYGNLVLIEVSTGKRFPVSSRIERPGRNFPAQWSRDSRVFIYSKEGKLYYFSIATLSSVSVDEQFKIIGNGLINSVYWGPQGDFFYVNGRTIYRVRSTELFTRSLYTSFLDIGQVAGILPFTFDPSFDLFWIHPSSKAIIVSKSGQSVFYFPLIDGTNAVSSQTGQSSIYPYLVLPSLCSDIKLLWSADGIVTIWGLRSDNNDIAFAYRLDVSKDQGPYSFVPVTLPSISDALLSPDGSKAVLWGNAGSFIYSYRDWKPTQTITKTKTLSAGWLNNDELVIGDIQFIYVFKLPNNRTILGLSQVDAYGFEDKSGTILAKTDNSWFSTDGNLIWSPRSGKVDLRPLSVSSDRFRVYLEIQGGGPYRNLPMIRSMDGMTTRPLLNIDGLQYETISNIPLKDEVTSRDGVFNNGKRYGSRSISLTFDVIDAPEGLTTVLDCLKRYGIRVTFFVNGEFIRRYADLTRLLSNSGHEIGSLFYAPIDLSDTRYRVDAQFIIRGLARNEDEYYRTTGKELSALWHAPYYVLSPELIAAAAAAGYKTVGRDIDPLDWLGKTDVRRSFVPYRTASEMIDQIIQTKKPGSIIPIRIGANENVRGDYLFNQLDVLLDALLRAGYQIVPISTLMEQAK
ncbi:MAG: polysaccharide deacetylase family protein [Treponema sp.]|nr:polysaccharide deacetylase family protein [Treponema sp.]